MPTVYLRNPDAETQGAQPGASVISQSKDQQQTASQDAEMGVLGGDVGRTGVHRQLWSDSQNHLSTSGV